MRKLIVLFLLLVSSISYAWEQRQPLPQDTCKIHAPWGFPQTTVTSTICRQGYYVGYDAAAKIPKFVTYSLTPSHALGCIARTNAFVADLSVKEGPTLADYDHSGYDRGHQVPDGDLSWDQQVEYESFLMTNMAPQAGSFNRGIWKLLETEVRGWVTQLKQEYVIYVGSIYNDKDKKIGKGVVVPHAFYKVVVNTQTGEYAGWLFPHVAPYPNMGNDLTKYRATVEKIQTESGVKFSLPPSAKELATGKEWGVDFGKLTKEKRGVCSIKK